MLDLDIPLPYLIATAYLSVAAVIVLMWLYWDAIATQSEIRTPPFWIAASVASIAVLLGLIAVRHGSLPFSKSSPVRQIEASMDPRRGDGYSCPPDIIYNLPPPTRTRFDSSSSKVLGYPSSGGILMLPLDIAVADYLGVPRFKVAQPASSPADEDGFCDRMRLLGAKWWHSEEAYLLGLLEMEIVAEDEEGKKEGEMVVGWPSKSEAEGSGGVWVLRVKGAVPADFAMLAMCVNMEERCMLLKRWGATFYEDPADVAEFEEVWRRAPKEDTAS